MEKIIPKEQYPVVPADRFPTIKDIMAFILVTALVISSFFSLYYAFINRNVPLHLIFGSGLLILASLILYIVLFWQYQRIYFDDLYQVNLSAFRSGRQEFMKRYEKAKNEQEKSSDESKKGDEKVEDEQEDKEYSLEEAMTNNILFSMIKSHPDFVYVYREYIYDYNKYNEKYETEEDSLDFIEYKTKENTQRKLEDIGVDVKSYCFPILMSIGAVTFGVFLLTIRFVLSIESIRIPLDNGAISLPLYSFEWAFIGAYIYVLYDIIQRFVRKDLIPRVYILSALRMIIAPFSAVAVVLLLTSVSSGSDIIPGELSSSWLLLISFITGSAPFTTLRYVRKVVLKRFGVIKEDADYSGDNPTRSIEGVDLDTQQRLEEEDIRNVQTLALCNAEYLADKTKFSRSTIEDWRSQSILYLLTYDEPVKTDEGIAQKNPYEELRETGIRTADDLINSLESEVRGVDISDEEIPRDIILIDDDKVEELRKLLGWVPEKSIYLKNLCIAIHNLLQKEAIAEGKI
jgi:hypothetical protein